MTDDAQLLRQYVQQRSESAFGALVNRHLDLVYSTALRVVNGDRPLAQDVTQTVFADLARKAGRLPRDVVLPGWIYRHTFFTAAKAIRAERRRRARENIAHEMKALADHTEPDWEQLAPVLDQAMNLLSASDRDAVVLRFLKQQDFRAVGAALGVSEDAAQKRVSRALEKLRGFLVRRGVTLSAATLASALATKTLSAAPLGLAASVTAASLATNAKVGAGLLLTKIMGLTNTQTVILSVIVLTAPVAYQWHALNGAHAEQRRLTAELTGLRTGINSEERAVHAQERRLVSADATLAGLQADANNPKPAAGAVSGAADLYRWDEQSDYVRLPKSLASHLTFGDFEMRRRGKPRPERVQRPPMARDGTPAQALLNALGLSAEEAQQVSDAARKTFADFADQATSRSYFTNLDVSAMGGIAEYQTWFTPALPTEGESLQTGFSNALVSIMGPERTQTLWHQAESVFQDDLNAFGQAPRAVTIARLKNGGVVVGEESFQPDGTIRASRGGSVNQMNVPEALKPYVEMWGDGTKPQTGANP